MDLHLIPGAVASPAEWSAIDKVLGPPSTSSPLPPGEGQGEGNGARVRRQDRSRRDLLLPALHAAQGQAGFISPGALNYICQRLDVPPAEAYGVASFYAMLSTEPAPPTMVHVCDDLACRVNGALDLCREMERLLGDRDDIGWKPSPCLGLCERAPAVFLQHAGNGRADRSIAPASSSLSLATLSPLPQGEGQGEGTAAGDSLKRPPSPTGPRLLRRVGRVSPASLDDYRANGGYTALRKALTMGPEAVIREVTESGLVGRGGAAFPTGRKWEAVARAPVRPHYLVCNADESEPGTFKDRLLMEQDPFAIVEAMTIAAYATGCQRGYLYVRGEYPLALARMQNAVDAARSGGFLRDFDIEIRRGAGAYICGEETALFNSIQGLRGEPRNKPPYPTEAGLFGKPTLVNNVETLLNVLDIVLEGGQAFKESETKLFCVSGCVERPGIYEVPFGTTLRELLDPAGVRGSLRTVLLGGAAGTFLTPEQLDVPLTFEGTRAIGAALGSGAVLAFDDTVDMKDILSRITAFFREESCGQCVPCRVGAQRLEEAVHRLGAGRPFGSIAAEFSLIDDVAQAMRDASICGLGQTAPSALQSAIKLGLLHVPSPLTGEG